MKRRQFNTAVMSAAALIGSPALAQSRPIRIFVGFPPGGSTDAVARLLAEALRGKLDGPVVVENRAGAAGRIAVEHVKAAEKDGTAVLLTPNVAVTVYPHVYRRLSYDPMKDLSPVARLVSFPLVLGVGPKVPVTVTTVPELMKWLRANPNAAFYGSSAPGSTPHFVGQMLGKKVNMTLSHVAYRGDAPAVQDLLGGQISMSVNPPAAQVPHVASGRLRILATTGARRASYLPDSPTLLESGYDIQTADWFGAFVPSGVPPEKVQRLQAAIREAMTNRDLLEGLAKVQLDPAFLAGTDFARLIKSEYDQWGPIVKDSGFSLDE